MLNIHLKRNSTNIKRKFYEEFHVKVFEVLVIHSPQRGGKTKEKEIVGSNPNIFTYYSHENLFNVT